MSRERLDAAWRRTHSPGSFDSCSRPVGARTALKMTKYLHKSAEKGPCLPLRSLRSLRPLRWMLSSVVGDHAVIPEAQQAFPPADGEWQNAFQLVVVFLVCPIHHSRHEAKAAGVVCGRAHAGLHKWARDRVHLMKAGIGESFLRGERVGGERCAQ